MSLQPIKLQSGNSLQSLAGELYLNTSYFRELADFNNLDIIDLGNGLVLDELVTIGEEIQVQTQAEVIDAAKQVKIEIRENLARIEDEAVSTVNKVLEQLDIQDLDLSGIRTANGESPSQLVSWLLGN